MDTPGYDPPCTTGLVASGANVLVFTTGRGSVLGLKPTPCIKVATNTPMYERMIADMDLDAGPILEGEPVESVGRRLFDLILDVASGAADQERAGTASAKRSSRLGPSGPPCEAGDQPAASPADSEAPRARRLRAIYRWLAILAIAEFAWLAWFLIVPLPNANNTRNANRRRRPPRLALAQGVPRSRARYVVSRVVLGQWPRRAEPRRKPAQRVPILLAAGLIAAAAIGLGDLVVARLEARAGIWGSQSESRSTMASAPACSASSSPWSWGRLGWLESVAVPMSGSALLAAVGGSATFPALAATDGSELTPVDLRGWALRDRVRSWCVMILGCDAPFDRLRRLEYHLQGPKEYYQAGRIAFLPHNVYTNMPFGVEMLHLLAMEVMGDWWWGGLGGPAPGRALRPGGGGLDRGDGSAQARHARGLDRGARLSLDAVDLSPGGDRLCRRTALLLSRGPGLGRSPRLVRIARSPRRRSGVCSGSWPAARWAASTRL